MQIIKTLTFAFIFVSNFCLAQFTNSNLPIIVIQTNGNTIVDEPKINVEIKVLYHSNGSNNYLTDTDYHYNNYAGIEFHGSASQFYPKKSYSIELRNNLSAEVKFAMFGLPAESDWILIADYNDQTHMKNTYVYDLWSKTGNYSTKAKHVEVVIDGEYMGLYVFTEKIKRNTNRIDIKKLEAKDTTFATISGGYIMEASRQIDVPVAPYTWVSTHNSSPASNFKMTFDCKYPKEPVTKQFNYIKSYISDFENALESADFKDATLGFRKYADENSFAENFIIQEYTFTYDIFARSQYLYKDRDKKLIASTLWDANPGLFENSATSWKFSCSSCSPRFFWVERMMQDCDFKSNVITKYKDFRQSFLTIAKGHSYVDSLSNIIQYAAARDRAKWFPTLSINFTDETQKLKNFISIRINWMDLNIHTIKNDGNVLSSSANNASTNQSVTLVSNCSNANPVTWRFDNSDGTTGTFVGTNTVNVLILQSVTYTAICQVDGCTKYSNIQHISFNNNCLDELNFTSHLINPPVQKFDTKHSIISSAKLSFPSKMVYSAGNSVLLSTGFQASSGSVFIAQIGGCQ